MTGKKQVERKVIGKKHQRLSPRKLDLKKEMEGVKLLGGLVAGVTTVQTELTEVMDGLLKPEGNTNANLEGLQITAHQIRQVNILGAELNAMVQDYLYGLLHVLDQAGEDKGH
ncbi:uncharacterized protein LOC111300244 [Durio zibethinus]|uniref:Uncharacterized protein LOC111300244 n=1 Tax=Durio zibethinus TaxID=66656 RepID=A0A6P5ZGI7_DURZI|nr:uncharacterized protein LOC111300244 [Durio zibethinus]